MGGAVEALGAILSAAPAFDFLRRQVADHRVGGQVAVVADADHAVTEFQRVLDFAQDALQLIERQVAGRQLLADTVEQFQ